MENPFKWRHFQPEIILLRVRWYFRNSLSFKDIEEMMASPLSVGHLCEYKLNPSGWLKILFAFTSDIGSFRPKRRTV